MTENNINLTCCKETTVCFTGHRPEGFPFSPDDKIRTNIIKSMLLCKIKDAYDAGYRTFITGMARGVDMWAAMCVVHLKSVCPDIRLIGVSPFKSEYERRKGLDKWEYGVVCEAADEVIYLHDSYIKSCYHERNRFMVDRSSMVIGVVYNRKSGTGGTLYYAAKKGVKLDVIDVCELAKNKII